MKQLAQDEDHALIHSDLTLDMTALNFSPALSALLQLKRLKKEWLELQGHVLKGKGLEECQCQILLRYSLHRKHYLLRACLPDKLLPDSLIHPKY
jgi:hypothetical protein